MGVETIAYCSGFLRCFSVQSRCLLCLILVFLTYSRWFIYLLRKTVEHHLASDCFFDVLYKLPTDLDFFFLYECVFLAQRHRHSLFHIVYLLSFSSSADAVICFLSKAVYRRITLLDRNSELQGFPEEKLPEAVCEISHLPTTLITSSPWNNILNEIIHWKSYTQSSCLDFSNGSVIYK